MESRIRIEEKREHEKKSYAPHNPIYVPHFNWMAWIARGEMLCFAQLNM